MEYFSYSHDALPGYQVIDLPFTQSDMSMIFVLPLTDDSNSNGGAVLSADVISVLICSRLVLHYPYQSSSLSLNTRMT